MVYPQELSMKRLLNPSCNTTFCDMLISFISQLIKVFNIGVADTSCESPWSYRSGPATCIYAAHDVEASWIEARAWCEAIGPQYRLYIVNAFQKHTDLTSYINSELCKNLFWFSGRQSCLSKFVSSCIVRLYVLTELNENVWQGCGNLNGIDDKLCSAYSDLPDRIGPRAFCVLRRDYAHWMPSGVAGFLSTRGTFFKYVLPNYHIQSSIINDLYCI